MKRLLLSLAALAALLAFLSGWLEGQRRTKRAQAGVLRPLPRNSNKPVVRLEVRSGDLTWVYVRRDSLWRYPARYNAFVLPTPINYLVDGIQRGPATALAVQIDRDCGFEQVPPLGLKLSDTHGNTVQEITVGRGVPSRQSNEACVKSEGFLFRLHANPRLVLNGNPPMVDPFVLPQALGRRDIAQIEFGTGGTPIRKVERIQTGPAIPLPGQPPRGPSYRWVAHSPDRVDTCNDASVYAYTSYLSRLRYQRLEDPRADKYGFASGKSLKLTDSTGKLEELAIGNTDETGHIYVRHQGSGLVYALAADKANLLFPNRTALLDSLAVPSPYQRAEPERTQPLPRR